MVNKYEITDFFVSVDDFCNIFEPELNKKLTGKLSLLNF